MRERNARTRAGFEILVDIAVIIDIEIALLVFTGIFAVFQRLGGWPEAWYRITRVDYFSAVFFQPDGTPDRRVMPSTEITTHSHPQFTVGKDTYTINEENAARINGRPAWYFNRDDYNAIPIRHWNKGPKISPALVYAAWQNKSLQEMHGIGQKKSNLPFILVALFAFLIVILLVTAAYYSYNSYCAVAPQNCGSVPSFHG